MSRVLTDSLTHGYGKCENLSLVFHPITLFPKQKLFVLSNNTHWIYRQFLFDLFKSSVFMHLWTTDFRVLITGRCTSFYIFTGFHRWGSCITATTGFFTRWGSIPTYCAQHTHIFFMSCNRETPLDVVQGIELTTHSPRIMNDYNHAHIPNSMRCVKPEKILIF